MSEKQPKIHDAVVPQLDALVLEAGRPLVITDADEVLFLFLQGFEAYLEDNGHYLDLSSFALVGNIKNAATEEMAPVEVAKALLDGFFRERTETMTPVPGAAEALAALSARAQVVVLSNLPESSRGAREKALALAGMPYPIVANIGLKGPVVRHMAERVQAPVFFLDDIPHNHTSVAQAAPEVQRVHFIADPRLARLIGQAEHSNHRVDDWAEVRRLIERELELLGW
ncbi:hypothetical protein [Zavarzinia compransoris]|uniref:HAD family hydrolase n=1 Tax=Zavarzinia compransoris TaxID=1264899 RepID=A0A317E953_9PROT|nr:hypothetical protein [Zavarzinia compransoris]PWR23429.1 hypothetical protein DKG75_02330 [Zavarzinia compransoris]TDP45995.1 hypothetical protein DES42_10476 [Zavarzinia compransoris]